MSMIGNLLRVTNKELNQYLQDSSLLEERVYNDEEAEPNLIDIDKSWDGIFFLLTGENYGSSEHPMAKVLFSEQFINEEQELGYGPAQYLTPEQVKEVAAQLSKLSVEELRTRFNANQMTELHVYPEIWKEDDGALDYLLNYYKDVQKFYITAAERNEAVITFLN